MQLKLFIVKLGLFVFASYFSAVTFSLANEELARDCHAPNELIQLIHPLVRTSIRLTQHEPLKVVAIGSSSTAGAGASSAAASYPSRLAEELRKRFPGQSITVLNRGVNGEEIRDILARLDRDVISEKPDLVLWQLGTNSVLRDHPLAPAGGNIHEGISRIKSINADIVLIDPQFAPRVIAKHDAENMVKLISSSAKEDHVNLFQRFSIMRSWYNNDHMTFADFLSPDELHMNDWSYACLAKLLSTAIVETVTRNVPAKNISKAHKQ